jgi:hypothetical protein
MTRLTFIGLLLTMATAVAHASTARRSAAIASFKCTGEGQDVAGIELRLHLLADQSARVVITRIPGEKVPAFVKLQDLIGPKANAGGVLQFESRDYDDIRFKNQKAHWMLDRFSGLFTVIAPGFDAPFMFECERIKPLM